MNSNNIYMEDELLKLVRSPNVREQDMAFVQLYKKNYRAVQTMILKNSGKEEDAKDTFQEALIITHRNLRKDGFTLNCQIGTYVYSVARNIWLKKLRTKVHTDSIEDTNAKYIEVDDDNYQLIEQAKKFKEVNSMISQLKEDCQKVLKFYYYERLRMREIALKMGYSNDQVAKNKKSSCLRKLKHLAFNNPLLKQ